MDYATLLGTMLLLYYTVRHERWNGCYAFFFLFFFFRRTNDMRRPYTRVCRLTSQENENFSYEIL